MARKGELKESYDIEFKNAAFYIAGKLFWSNDGGTLLCGASDVINVLDVNAGRVKGTLGSTEADSNDPVLAFTSDATADVVVSAHKSGLFKKWDVVNSSVTKTWKSIHKGPVCELALNNKAEVLASGATDGIIRLWNLTHHSCTHALWGCQGVVSVLKYRAIDDMKRIFACGDDLKIRCWETSTGKLLNELEGHFSKVTDLAFPADPQTLISCARDKVLILWDLTSGSAIKTVPVYETLESVVLMPIGWTVPDADKKADAFYAATAGDKGVIRVFDLQSSKEVYVQTESKATAAINGGLSIVQLLLNVATSRLAVVTADQNIIIHSLVNFKCEKQLIGYADEILDVCILGPDDSHVAVATNSADIKVYNVNDMGCQLLRAHTDFVLSLANSGVDRNMLLSAGKDNSVRLWRLNPSDGSCCILATGYRHTAAVQALSFTCLSPDMFLSASVDTTLKIWRRESDNAIMVAHTQVAHSKDINCLTVAPNDKLAATASQDKTVKLWSLPDLSLVGVLSGHKRGVWSVRFSPVDRIIMTTSADCTIKLWSVADRTCVKTFEGHESSVIRARFLSRGMQIISCSGDGLLKIWSIKTSECTATFDGHNGKIWALDMTANEERIISGGSDSQLLVWRNTTEEKKIAAQKEREELMLQEQQLNNMIQAERLLDALVLALSLDRPYKVLNIIKDLMNKEKTEGLTKTLAKLSVDQKEKLLKCAAAWNCNAKHSAAAQLVISVMIDEIATGKLVLADLSEYLQDVLPYTERHFKRLSETLQGLQMLQYTINLINPAMSTL